MSSPPAGWFPDPDGPPGQERWWNGSYWGNTRSAPGNSGGGLVAAGWITFALGLLFWPVFIAPFVIGIILAARGVVGHGVALIVLSVLGPLISLVVIATWLSGS